MSWSVALAGATVAVTSFVCPIATSTIVCGVTFTLLTATLSAGAYVWYGLLHAKASAAPQISAPRCSIVGRRIAVLLRSPLSRRGGGGGGAKVV
jgi:hypothetical protein